MSENYQLPTYVSPLTDAEHAQLGRIAVLWGQADWLMDEIILEALAITPKQRATLIGEKPLGTKIALVKRHLSDIKHGRAQEAARGFIERLELTKDRRNHIFHGMWGWRANVRKRAVERCVRHQRSLENPVKAEDLPALEASLCDAVTQGLMAVVLIRGREPEAGVYRFLHGRDDELPDWFREWAERNPLLGDSWDPDWQPGQLCRLKDPRA